MQIGKAARSNGSHIKSRLKMEPHGVFKEVTKQCTNKDHYQSVSGCSIGLSDGEHGVLEKHTKVCSRRLYTESLATGWEVGQVQGGAHYSDATL